MTSTDTSPTIASPTNTAAVAISRTNRPPTFVGDCGSAAGGNEAENATCRGTSTTTTATTVTAVAVSTTAAAVAVTTTTSAAISR